MANENLLFTALSTRNIKLAKILVLGGVTINCKNSDGLTPLMIACNMNVDEKKKFDIIKCLLDNNVDIRETDTAGRTALMYAIKSGSTSIIQLLKRHGLTNSVKTVSVSNNDDTDHVPTTRSYRCSRCYPCKSPPSIALPIPSAGGGPSQYVVCKSRCPKLVVVPTNARFNIFLDKLIILTVGARSCPGQLCNEIFLPDALDRISHSQSS
ncbi:unnamed protein product [Mytilus coruscus]|uniref:Uncharacterized protein n=1 Tax=Mytilus coruscus TaxID=42192 RepID=A0A6J8ANI2_MYTCO|nr:unnamed protein product [Mytilus coruscus]